MRYSSSAFGGSVLSTVGATRALVYLLATRLIHKFIGDTTLRSTPIITICFCALRGVYTCYKYDISYSLYRISYDHSLVIMKISSYETYIVDVTLVKL